MSFEGFSESMPIDNIKGSDTFYTCKLGEHDHKLIIYLENIGTDKV